MAYMYYKKHPRIIAAYYISTEGEKVYTWKRDAPEDFEYKTAFPATALCLMYLRMRGGTEEIPLSRYHRYGLPW